jgi:heme exporter protein D
MGRTSRSDRSAARRHDSTSSKRGAFTLWIALGSTAVALAIFFSDTVGAITEMRFLQNVAQERRAIDRDLSQELKRDTLHRIGLDYDLQSLLVELDKRGIPMDTVFSQDIPEGDEGEPR